MGPGLNPPPFLNYKSKCAHHKASISPDRQTTSGWLFSRSPVSSLFNLMTYMVQKNSRSVLQRAWLNGCISTSPEANQTKPNQIKPKPIKQKPNQTKTTWSGWNLLKILPIWGQNVDKIRRHVPRGRAGEVCFPPPSGDWWETDRCCQCLMSYRFARMDIRVDERVNCGRKNLMCIGQQRGHCHGD